MPIAIVKTVIELRRGFMEQTMIKRVLTAAGFLFFGAMMALVPASAQSSTSRFATQPTCPDQSAMGTEYFDISHDDIYAAKYFDVTAGGDLNLADCPDVPGLGYIIGTPDYSINYTANEGQSIEISVNAECDTILLVNTPADEWYWDDDTNGLQPEMVFTHTTNGIYDIWVGTVDASTCDAEIRLESFNSSEPVCPDQMGMGSEYNINHADIYSAKYFDVTAGGDLNLANCPDVPGVGYIIENPDFSINYNAKSSQSIKINVNAECDTILLVNTPTNEWYWDDDTNGLQPEIVLSHSANGYYDIWVGTVDASSCNAEIRLESFN